MCLNQSEKAEKKGTNLSKIEPINKIKLKTNKIRATLIEPNLFKQKIIARHENKDNINWRNDKSCSFNIPLVNFGEKIMESIDTIRK